MKSLIIVTFITLLNFNIANANCRGCCSRNKGVICHKGITQCRNGSSLSAKCKSKGCNKCGSATIIQQKKAPIQVSNKSEKYNRKLYRHWIDDDDDCQNTRAEVLIQFNIGELKFKTKKHCVVISGKWLGPYSGKIFTKANDLDVDHIIPLKKAHGMGAKDWIRDKRKQFANDFENLLPVWKRLNRQKGANGPVKWMPPLKKYHCQYLKQWKHIKKKYKLKQLVREIASIDAMSASCKSPSSEKR